MTELEFSRIDIAGLKSIGDRQSLELRPLTILAGANSSGKSTMMQGLLLLKQTLEAPYDPGPLLIRGPNVAFTSVEQLFHRSSDREHVNNFDISISGFEVELEIYRQDHYSYAHEVEKKVELRFSSSEGHNLTGPIQLVSQKTRNLEGIADLAPDTDKKIIAKTMFETYGHLKRITTDEKKKSLKNLTTEGAVLRNRCFLEAVLTISEKSSYPLVAKNSPARLFIPAIEEVIHLPGLRGNPERNYPLTAIARNFPGTFENYAATVIARWTMDQDERLETLGYQLSTLGLTWKVEARPIDDTQVELRVGRLPKARRGGANDLVSIADVGLGVSQTLPVLVSLLVARPGQLVYIEQPEIHLHPRAQFALAKVVAEAANRGVRAVIETHSSLFLLGVQALVAEGKLAPEKVKLNWFSRSENTGSTTIRSAELDKAGRFGDWPEDFADVTLEAEGRYLDAVDARLAKGL